MRVLHLTCVRELTSGQRKQLTYEYNASKSLKIKWDVMSLHTKNIENEEFEKQIPKNFRFIFLRNLYGWIYILNHQKDYDIIINRHMTFDPFVLIFGWFIKNRFSVHHAKEIEELKLIRKNWQGILASFIEKIVGKVNLFQVKGTISVTNEIAEYQKKLYNKPILIYPNGINYKTVDILKDKRQKNEINIGFVCGSFSSWHGLDLLLKEILLHISTMKRLNVKIHLIGNVLPAELSFISSNINLSKYIIIHGLLSGKEYTDLLSVCDIGLSSFSLEKKNLFEAATLKVREYLAFGIPVYSGHKDTAINDSFPYYINGNVDINKIIEFAQKMKFISREKVRNKSEDKISKEKIMLKLYEEILHLNG